MTASELRPSARPIKLFALRVVKAKLKAWKMEGLSHGIMTTPVSGEYTGQNILRISTARTGEPNSQMKHW